MKTDAEHSERSRPSYLDMTPEQLLRHALDRNPTLTGKSLDSDLIAALAEGPIDNGARAMYAQRSSRSGRIGFLNLSVRVADLEVAILAVPGGACVSRTQVRR